VSSGAVDTGGAGLAFRFLNPNINHAPSFERHYYVTTLPDYLNHNIEPLPDVESSSLDLILLTNRIMECH
jgi:hypothetical protein